MKKKKYIKVPEKLNRGRKLTSADVEFLKKEFKKYKNTSYGVRHSKQEWYRFMAEKFDVHPRTIMYHVEPKINEAQKQAGRKIRLSTERQKMLKKQRLKRFPKQKEYYGDVNNPVGPRRLG